MNEGIYSAASGAVAQSRLLETVSNNLANSASSGYKADRASFREVLIEREGVADPTQSQVMLDEIRPDFSQGRMRKTGRSLDVALHGPGFFAVQTDHGQMYSRGGALTTTTDGVLTTLTGAPILGESGVIRVGSQERAHIDAEGRVFAGGEFVDRLQVVDFQEPERLTRAGEGLWRAPDDAIPTPVDGRVRPGNVEGSNVNAIAEMSELVSLSRAYEQFNRTIEIFRTIDQKIANEIS